MALLFNTIVKSQAFVLDPILHAADEMGYEVVGEVEFRQGSRRLNESQVRDNLSELNRLCPVGQAREAHFVILAWSDREFPDAGEEAGLSSEQALLANERALAVQERLGRNLKGMRGSFERVNMASRSPQRVRVSSRARATNGDIKQVLKLAGAAPSGALELGLFGENGQHSKAVIWVDCAESTSPPQRVSRQDTFQLARNGAKLNEAAASPEF